MSFRFKPESFPCDEDGSLHVELAADRANQLLDEYFETLPQIFANTTNMDVNNTTWCITQEPYDTHRARILCIEEIKPKKCEHLVDSIYYTHPVSAHMKTVCKLCGKRLVAKWQEAE